MPADNASGISALDALAASAKTGAPSNIGTTLEQHLVSAKARKDAALKRALSLQGPPPGGMTPQHHAEIDDLIREHRAATDHHDFITEMIKHAQKA